MLKPYFEEPKDRDFLIRYFFQEYIPTLSSHLPAPRARKTKSLKDILRLGSYNIHYHQNYCKHDERTKEEYNEDIRAAIKAVDADVIVLQEVQDPHSVLPHDEYPYVTFYEAEGKYWQMGNAICSKYPLQDVKCTTFHAKEELMQVEPRCFIAATIEPKKGYRIRLIGTHLDVTDNSEMTRCHQVEQLHEEMVLSGVNNTCCLGDFNAISREDYDDNHWNWIEMQDRERKVTPTTKAMDCILGDLKWKDSHFESHLVQGMKRGKLKRDFNVSTWSMRRIDYALLSPSFNLKVDDAMVYYDSSSDHVPIAVDINL